MAVFSALLLFAAVAGAQAPVGSISGQVTDPSGAAITGANLKATSVASGGVREAKSNDEGFYLIPTLLPAEYKVSIEYPGFAKYESPPVVVEVGQTTRLDVMMSVAANIETVDVTGGAVTAVDTAQSGVGGVVNMGHIDELPLNGRNYLELARLQPGVEIRDGSAFDPTKTRYTGVSVGGRMGRESRITIDGVDAVDEHVGTTTLNISQDSIREFQVSISGSDASTGLSATGAVNVITRSGSNEIHGSAFAFGRGSNLAARPNFAAQKPDFDREQYGLRVGGPVRKDKLFWFGNFEKTRENSSISINTPYFPTLLTYPAPFDETSNTVRADWHVSRSNDSFFRWTRDDNSNFGGFGGNRVPSTGNVNTNTTNQFAWGLDSVLTAKLINSFRVGYTDFKNHIVRPPEEAQKLAVPGAENFRILTDDGLLVAGPDVNTPQSTFERFNQFRDDLTYSRGRHTWRFGGDLDYRKVTVTNFVAGFPSFVVASPASHNVADLLDSAWISVTIGNRNGKRIPGTPDNSHRNTRISWYVQDSWRLRPNFILNYGLRYEVDTHPLDNDLAKPDLAAPLLPRGTAPTPIDKNNFAPQIGFASDPFNDHKTSIRAGAGIYYAMLISNLVTNERATLAPFNSGNDTVTLQRGTSGLFDFTHDGQSVFDFTPALGAPLRAAIPIINAGQAVYVAAKPGSVPTLAITRTGLIISNQFSTPYSSQVNFGVQRETPLNSVLDVNFLYSRTVHEVERDIDGSNLFPGNGAPITLGDGSAPDRTIAIVRSDGFSRYRALTARWDKRFSQHYQFTASYALARLETTVPDGLGLGGGSNGPIINRNMKANFGPGALDRTHRVSFSGIAELPRGFRLSLISALYSPLPNTILVGSADLNGDGINGDPLPGTGRGSLNRGVDTPAKLNSLIRQYNQTTAGKPLPKGGRAPFVIEVPDSLRFGQWFVSQDFQLSKTFKIKEKLRIEAVAQVFNLFNVSNLVGPDGGTASPFNGSLTTINADATGAPAGFRLGSTGSLLNAAGSRALAGVDRASGFAGFSAARPSIPTGTGLPRAAQFGLRITF
ncbi:MAG TPA: carboxypeptidase regulatory-like domain-containing protein [Bryobacterales bacterium]|nr:carboxypeptidase regulatory-like domain-containing protein [Bryobacterales bacterium]